jgi:hypothetical protein
LPRAEYGDVRKRQPRDPWLVLQHAGHGVGKRLGGKIAGHGRQPARVADLAEDYGHDHDGEVEGK